MKIQSKGILLDIDNIDTDQIIPAQFLKSTHKKGFGDFLFFNWRYDENKKPKEDFPLNNQEGSILITGNNFGCGSSREHAAWALEDFGIKAIISSQFADIFKGNALNNNIIPIEVKPQQLEKIKSIFSINQFDIEINLEQQKLMIPSHSIDISFEIDPMKKKYIINGTNELDFMMEYIEKIKQFEKTKHL